MAQRRRIDLSNLLCYASCRLIPFFEVDYMKLHRVVLKNFRSHEDVEFIPAQEGITSINGPTGSGKSSIIDGVSWCLFGVRPQGVPNFGSLKRSAVLDDKDAETRVLVDFSVAGRTLRAERWFKGKGSRVYCELKENTGGSWEVIAGPAVKDAESAVRTVVQMTSQGFFTAVMVRQKSVDDIVTASAKERGEIIEKLTGLSAIKDAIGVANKERLSLRNQVKGFDFDPKELSGARGELDKVVSLHAKKKERLSAVRESLAKIREEREQLEEKRARHEKNSRLNAENARAESLLEGELTALKGGLDDLVREKDDFRALVPDLAKTGSLEDAEADYSRGQASLASLRSREGELSREIDALAKGVKTATDAVNALGGKDTVETRLKGITEALSGLRATVSESEAEVSKRKLMIDSYSRAIDVIQREHGVCPTCLQEVDDVERTVSFLRSEREKADAERSVSESRMTEARDKVSALEAELGDLSEALSGAAEMNDVLLPRMSEAKKEREAVSKRVKSGEAKIKVIEKRLSEARHAESSKKAYENAQKRLQDAIASIEKKEAELSKVRKASDKLPVLSDAKFEALSRKISHIGDDYESKRESESDLRAELSDLTAQGRSLKERVADLESREKKYQGMLRSAEMTESVKNVLEEFRSDRMDAALPTLEMYASDLLARFTDGKFVGLTLDDKFNAAVRLSSGEERPAGLLSGGELSASALALRLAVSMLLSEGKSDNLIVLDEVLVSQDADRAQLILSAVKDVFSGQVIFISHSDNVDSVSDESFSVA